MVAMFAPLPFTAVTDVQTLGTFCAIGGAFWLVGMATFVIGTTLAKWRSAR